MTAPRYTHSSGRLDTQSDRMLLERGERDGSGEELSHRPADHGDSGGFDLVVDDEPGSGRVLGWLSVEALPHARVRHAGYLVIGVDADVAGRGAGSQPVRRALKETRAEGRCDWS